MWTTVAAVCIVVALWVLVRRRRLRKTVGFFHPYCGAGGGGERVLWIAVSAVLQQDEQVRVQVYARSQDCDGARVLREAANRFGARLEPGRIDFCPLQTARLLDAAMYPRLTMLGQSLGSIIVGAEALYRAGGIPEVFFDSMGYAFTYPLAWLLGATVACYTHYPTISSDMLERVYQQRPSYNNDQQVSGSVVSSRAKYYYYLAFAQVYRLAGWFAGDNVVVNSNWTRRHIEQLWRCRHARVIFPPCDVQEFSQASRLPKERVVVSLGQFRPEKDHRLQIQALRALETKLGSRRELLPTLRIFGSCRDEEDQQRLEELGAFADKLGLRDKVEFCVNQPFSALKASLGVSLLGVHTMWNEHFGIAPVEMMASGVILVAHDSGGPKEDIIKHGDTGYLATSAEEYAEAMLGVLRRFDDPRDDGTFLNEMRSRALASMQRFTQDKFARDFSEFIRPLLCRDASKRDE